LPECVQGDARDQAAEAKKRQATSTGGKKPQLRAKLPQAEGKARDQVAEVFGVPGHEASKRSRLHANGGGGWGYAPENGLGHL
jgi:hypothetical protein